MHAKARYVKNGVPAGRAYTFNVPEGTLPDDKLRDPRNGSKLIAVDEPVDEDWIETYGANKLVTLEKDTEEGGGING